jgi:hypothetical protein
MCRYAYRKYKLTYGCFKCQVGFKRQNLIDVNPNATISKDFNCPNCGTEMANLGRDLRLPAKHKDEQWACIKYLVDHKYNIYSCGCQGIGFVPHKMEDAVELVKSVEINLKKYTYKEAQKEKKVALEQARKKKQDALRTRMLLREAKNESKNEIKSKLKIEFLSFVISNKRNSQTLLENFASSKNLKLPFEFIEKDLETEIKIEAKQLLTSEILELQMLFAL